MSNYIEIPKDFEFYCNCAWGSYEFSLTEGILKLFSNGKLYRTIKHISTAQLVKLKQAKQDYFCTDVIRAQIHF